MATSISILGNTGRDVELRYNPQGTPIASFSVASNSFRKTANGKEQKTDWYNITAYGRQAETLSKHLKKGNPILVRGKLTFNPWTNQEGQARVSADVQLQDFEFVGGAPVSQANSRQLANTEQNASDEAQHGLSEEILEALRDAGAEAHEDDFNDRF